MSVPPLASCSWASLVIMCFLILMYLRWFIYIITCFSSTLYFEKKLLIVSPSFMTLTEWSSYKSFKHFLGRQMKCPRLCGSGTGCGILSVSGSTHLLLEHAFWRIFPTKKAFATVTLRLKTFFLTQSCSVVHYRSESDYFLPRLASR